MSSDRLQQAIAAFSSAIGEARNGLPEPAFLFVSSITPMINVDLLIKDERGRTLLTWRDDKFYGAGWHVPGGIIRFQETLETRLRETARRELGVEIEYEPVPVAIAEGIDRKLCERGHFISLLYRCRVLSPPEEALRAASGAPTEGQWRWHERCPDNLIAAQSLYRRFL